MSFFPSFFTFSRRDDGDAPPLPPRLYQKTINGPYEALCLQVEQQQSDLESLEKSNYMAENTIKSLESQLHHATRIQLPEAQEEVKVLRRTVKSKNAVIVEREQSITKLKESLRTGQDLLRGQKDLRIEESKVATAKLARARAETVQARDGSARVEEAKQALEDQVALRSAGELRGLPIGILQSQFRHQRSMLIQPFVIVLIDGDSYSFLPELTSDHIHGGTRAAQRLSSEIFRYILAHAEIPVYCKVIIRVFYNATSKQGKLKKDGSRHTPEFHTFMIRFSETRPLFDFLDCGTGRERADVKLQENFDLFISNPYCCAAFLAICYDNGFVRMLEPYQEIDAVQNKIILIKAGQTAWEFSRLPFEQVEFPTVFKTHYSDKIGLLKAPPGLYGNVTTESTATTPRFPGITSRFSTTFILGLTRGSTLLSGPYGVHDVSSTTKTQDESVRPSQPNTPSVPETSKKIANLQRVIQEKQKIVAKNDLKAKVRNKQLRLIRDLQAGVQRLQDSTDLRQPLPDVASGGVD